MKTKVKRMSKRTLAMLLGVLMLVTSIGLGAMITVNAYTINGGRIYFDTAGNWADAKYIYSAIWYDNGGKNTRYLERLYNIPNTTVYTTALQTINRTDVSSMRFIGTTSSWVADNGWRSYEDGKGSYDGKYYTAECTMDMNNDSIYYGKVTSDDKNTSANFRYDNNAAKYINDNSAYYVSGTNYNNNAQSITVQRLVNGAWTDNGNNPSKAGTVSISARYYSDYQSTSALGNSGTHYDNTTYNNGALHTYATAKVESVASGYTFAGWYEGETFKSAEEEYTYFITGATALKARFFKADEAYSTDTPANEKKVDSGTLLITGFDSKFQTYNRTWVWDGSHDGRNIAKEQIDTTGVYKITNAMINAALSNANEITTSKAPNVRLTNGSATGSTTYPSGDEYTINAKTGQSNSSAIYYANNTYNWTNFEHLEITLDNIKDASSTTITDASTSGRIDNPGQTLTINASLSGTLKSGSTVKFYYTNDNGSNYYLIGTNSSVATATTSMTFIPPSTGKYKFYATITDGKGLEVDVPAGNQFDLTVGTEGYYVSGNTEFVGTNGNVAPSKGKMTNTSGTLWKKTFKSVPAGNHNFRITNLNNYLSVGNGSASETYTLTGDGVTLTPNGDNIDFTLDGKSKVTVTVDSTIDSSGKYPVTVKVEEVAPKTVTVYANTGGTVAITYDGATFNVAAGKNTKIKVGEGDSINLVATPAEGYSFDRWEKNLETSYSEAATLNDETIDDTTVYVADFDSSSGSGDWTPTKGGTTPGALSIGNTKANYIVYSSNDNGPGKSGTQVETYQNGNNYFADLTDVINTNGFYFALSTNQNNNGICGNYSEQANSQTSNIDINDSSGNKLFKVEIRNNGNVSNNAEFLYIYSFDTSKYSAIGVQAVWTGSGKVNYQFYYKPAGGGGVDEGTEYNASVTYYAKDSNFREQSTKKNTYINTDTTVEAVEGIVTVTDDSANNMQTGKAVKGCDITVSTTISGTCKNGTGGATVDAADKFYVVGYSFNGITPEILSEVAKNGRNEATYTCTYTIPADMTESKLEITPIFFLKDAYDDNTAMFYINGYDDTIKDAGWGNTLFIYPFYRRYESGDKTSHTADTTFYGQAQNFSGYPGQPVVNYGGQLYTQIPLTNDGSAEGTDACKNPIKGVTINNGYFDNCHQGFCKFVTNHHQTYDYDDFQKIYKEKEKDSNGDKYLHSIFFSFKYYPQDTTNQHRLYTKTNTANSGSRYNDTIASGTRLSESKSVSSTKMDAYPASSATSGNKWEDLTDALGNKVDLFGNAVTRTTDHPIKVVSMGYEYNNSGEYATEWAVYYWDGSNYTLAYDSNSNAMGEGAELNSSIVPSALIMNTASSFANYTAMDGDQAITGYEALYTKLKDYAGYPVKICYEYDAPIHYNSPPAYRCDGRWTYTTVNDFVKSNIKIEYKAAGASDYTEDVFTNTNEGTNSHCKAYFTNSEYYGQVQSDSELIDASKDYVFKAEEGGSYEFVGWWTRDSAGKEMKIENVDENFVARSHKTANITFVARFDYVATGNLTISNTVATGQTGMATTYLGVTLINGTKETVIANVASNTAAVKLNSSYIASNSPYKIKIDLRTVPIGENTFESYACNTTNESDEKAGCSDTDIYNPTNIRKSTDTYTIDVAGSSGDIFSGDTQTVNQTVKAIEYVSTLTPVHYDYSITYNYTGRHEGESADSKSYTRTGSLNTTQIGDGNGTSAYTGTASTADKKLTADFLSRIAPFVSNFNEDINWNCDGAVSGQVCSYNDTTNTYTITGTVATTTPTNKTARTGYFTVPYVVDANGVYTINDEGGGADQVNKTDDQTFDVPTTYAAEFLLDNKQIKAPTQLRDTKGTEDTSDDVVTFFNYWLIKTTSGKEVGRCYYPEFNYIAYENYDITPVYTATQGYGALYADYQGTMISYIGNSRNQWNNGNKGNDTPYAGDLIYNDFIINFKPSGPDLIKNIAGAQTGVILQRVKEVELNSSGTHSKTLADYAKEDEDNITDSRTAAQNFVGGTSTAGYSQSKEVIDPTTQVNNKNRCHYARAMWSKAQASSEAAEINYTAKNYLFRAYSYMIIGETVTMSETPTYFTMYDIAVK